MANKPTNRGFGGGLKTIRQFANLSQEAKIQKPETKEKGATPFP